MKNKMKILIGVAAVMLAMVTVALADNYASYYINTTNQVVTAGGATTNAHANVVPALTTQTFNLSLTAGSTNGDASLWPACPLVTQDNMYNPSRWFSYQGQNSAMSSGTNTCVTYVENWAGTTDGSHWNTNPCPLIIIYSETAGSGVQLMTNWDSAGIQGYCLFTRVNTNAVAVTNTFVGTGFKRGL